MTINEIERKISTLNKLLENEKRKAEIEKDSSIGKYYKLDDTCEYKTIGKIKSIYELSDSYDYICDEVYFDNEYCELRNEADEYRKISELIFISKEEFNQAFEAKINKLRSKF